MDKIIILSGPTGVGKTKYSIELAKKINGEIISCDSFQIYKGLDIGTSKTTKEEAQGIVHHNIDLVDPDGEYNVAMFQKRTEKLISQIINKWKFPILVGGTGLYIHSIIYDLDFKGDQSNEKTRSYVNSLADQKGIDYLYEKLLEIDPETKKYVNKGNRQRITRAYEIYLDSGQLPSDTLANFRNPNKKYDFLYLVLNQDRQDLYTRINKRVDIMMEEGLKEEIDGLLDQGYNFNLRSFKAIGYKEFEDYYLGLSSLDEIVEKIKQHTRNYAKRQLTWFRREDKAIWINKDDFSSQEECLDYMVKISKEFING